MDYYDKINDEREEIVIRRLPPTYESENQLEFFISLDLNYIKVFS